MAKERKLSTYERFVKGIKDFEKSERTADDYHTMLAETSRAFMGGIGLGGSQIQKAIDEALKED